MCRKGSGHRRNGLTEPSNRGESVDGSKAYRRKIPWIEELSRSCTHLQEPPRGERSTSAGSGGSPKRKETESCRRGRSLTGKSGPSQYRTEGGWEWSSIAKRNEREAQKRRSAHHRRSRKGQEEEGRRQRKERDPPTCHPKSRQDQ